MGHLDLCHLQDGFASLVEQADPDYLSSFFLWLDLKIAQYKINGNFIPGLKAHRLFLFLIGAFTLFKISVD